MYLVRYLAFKTLCDYCLCTGATSSGTTLVPSGYVFVRLALELELVEIPFQIRQVLSKSGSKYTTSNGLNPTRAMFMSRGPSGPPLSKKILTL